MPLTFEELDYQKTLLGDISLRRRSEPRLDGRILYEVKLNDEFLMSSLFTEAEEQLSVLGLTELKKHHQHDLDIIVGGLGLGYTAASVLADFEVKTLTVIDVMEPVIDWHRRQLVPLGKELTSDYRCHLLHADFFAVATASGSFDNANPDKLVHAVLLDIDHSPSHWLNSENSHFYTATALTKMANKLHPGGVFGLWSNDPPEQGFIDLLDSVFESVKAHIVVFPNPYTGDESSNTVYLACKQAA